MKDDNHMKIDENHVPLSLNNRSIIVVGLGYVGLPLAVEFGKYRKVIGFDVNSLRISELKSAHDRTLEVEEEEIREASYLNFIDDLAQLSSPEINCTAERIFIITVPTPVNDAKEPDLNPLISACEAIGLFVNKGDVIILESTVYPGVTEEVLVPQIEKVSGLSFVSEDFYVGYSPERINPGDRERRLSDIVKVTSGSSPTVAKEIDAMYSEIITAGTFRASSIKVAEAAKVIENAQRDLNIAFVNELSIIFGLLGVDTDEVLAAAGTKWNFLPFKPGLVGGHCIGVDPYYLTYKSELLGYTPEVILSGRRINDQMGDHITANIIKLMVKSHVNLIDAKVGILGFSFKENCPDHRNTKVLDVIACLADWDIEYVVVDPWVDKKKVLAEFNIEVAEIKNLKGLDALIVAVAHDEFKVLTTENLRSFFGDETKMVIGDLKAIYSRKVLEASGFKVFRL